jgi:hypothetical protein
LGRLAEQEQPRVEVEVVKPRLSSAWALGFSLLAAALSAAALVAALA